MRLHAILAASLLAISPWSAVLAQNNDDDSARSTIDSSSDHLAAAGDDDSADSGTQASAPPIQAPVEEAEQEICDDDVDNDNDGLIDCDDLNDCAAFRTCGQIQGGWGWVIAAYGLSFAALLSYALMVTLRLRQRWRQGGN